MRLEEIYKKSDGFVYRKIGNETMLVPIKKAIQKLKSIYTLNETACRVWLLLDGKNTLNDIISTIANEYEVEKENLVDDIQYFIHQLESIGSVKTK